MVPGNDHAESFHNSVQLVKNAFESSFQTLITDFDHCWSASRNAVSFVSKKSQLRSCSCGLESKVGKKLPIQCFVGDFFDNLVQNFRKLDLGAGEIECTSSNLCFGDPGGIKFNHVKAFIGIFEGRRADVGGVLLNVKFARVGGVPSSNVAIIDSGKEEISCEASAVAPTVDIPAESVLKSALAGGISCAFSSFIMHPVDTVKTQVQASTLTLPEIIEKIPQIGARGLYKGSIPAVSGQFLGHGLRTAICEASKFVLVYLAPTLPDIQVQSAASLCSTVLGTTFRVPTEVIKQRLQAGIYENVGEALIGTWQQDGLKGFFRGTGATLCREIPFYVAGAGLYAESKKVIKQSKLKFLFQKQLQNSDVNNLKRMKAAEAYLPKLDKKGGTYIEMIDIDGSHIWNFIYRFWPNNKSRMYILENTGEFVNKHQLSTGDLVLVYQDRESKDYVIEAKKTLDNILSDHPRKKSVRKHCYKASAQGQADDTPMTDVAAPSSGVGGNLPVKLESTDCVANETQLMANAANGMHLLDYGLAAYNPSGNNDNVLNLPNQNDNSSFIYNDADFPSDYLFNMWEPGASSTQPIPSFQNLCFEDILKGL